jgi:uncharacterized membrane protein YhaH (DUF805 family)
MHWMFMPLRRYADFSGRSRRMEFWMWQLGKFIFFMVIFALFAAMLGPAIMSGNANNILAAGFGVLFLYLICLVVGLGILVPDIAVAVRRLHDTNRTGWWFLAPWIPYLLIFVSAGIVGSSGAINVKDPSTGPIAALGIVTMVAGLAVMVLGIVLLVFYFMEGTPGPNKYGPDPKADTGQVFS